VTAFGVTTTTTTTSAVVGVVRVSSTRSASASGVSVGAVICS